MAVFVDQAREGVDFCRPVRGFFGHYLQRVDASELCFVYVWLLLYHAVKLVEGLGVCGRGLRRDYGAGIRAYRGEQACRYDDYDCFQWRFRVSG